MALCAIVESLTTGIADGRRDEFAWRVSRGPKLGGGGAE